MAVTHGGGETAGSLYEGGMVGVGWWLGMLRAVALSHGTLVGHSGTKRGNKPQPTKAIMFFYVHESIVLICYGLLRFIGFW